MAQGMPGLWDHPLTDVSTGQPRPLVRAGWWRQVFDVIHKLSCPGVRASVKLVGAKFVWLDIKKDIWS